MTVNLKLIGYFYLFLILLSLLAPLAQSFFDFSYGYIFLFFLYGIFMIGNLSCRKTLSEIELTGRNKLSYRFIFIIALFSLPCALYSIFFYTGKSPQEVITSLFLGVSNYNEYQKYFIENRLSIFSISKLSGIISLFIVKLSLVLSMVKLSIDGFNKVRVLSVIISITSMLYVSIGRGTSFEVFEILLAILFFTYSHYFLKKRTIPKKNFIALLVIVVISLVFYWFGINARYSGDYAPQSVNELIYHKNNVIPSVLSSILFQLSNYFLVGPLYLSVFVEKMFSSPISTFYFVLPGSGFLEGIGSKFLCFSEFDCGVAWTPSVEIFILNIGVFAFFIFVFILGFFEKKCSISFNSEPNMVDGIILYYVFLNMISLPVGNFIFNSSSNVLILFFVLMFKLKRVLI